MINNLLTDPLKCCHDYFVTNKTPLVELLATIKFDIVWIHNRFYTKIAVELLLLGKRVFANR